MNFKNLIEKGSQALGDINKRLEEQQFKSQLNGFEKYLVDGEVIEYKSVKLVVTNKRVLYLDAKFLSSKGVLSSVIFSKINCVSIEDEGSFKLGRNVILTVGGRNIEIDMFDTQSAYELFVFVNNKLLNGV